MKCPPNSQLDLFSTISEGRVNLLPVDEEPEPVEVVRPPASGNGKVHFDRADLERQLSDICPGNKIKVKINTRQDVAVKIDFRDKHDTVTVNPKQWRRTKKTALLESNILKAFANGH